MPWKNKLHVVRTHQTWGSKLHALSLSLNQSWFSIHKLIQIYINYYTFFFQNPPKTSSYLRMSGFESLHLRTITVRQWMWNKLIKILSYNMISLWHHIKATATDKQSRAVDLVRKTKWYCFTKNNKSDYPSPPQNRKQYPLGKYWGYRYEGVASPHLVSAVPSGSRLHTGNGRCFILS